ncbi:putative ATP-grasp superfamily ATP-dependent carboligase [Methanohalophilus levihalophilus]|uniref:ATP-grasp domain-containing protein n=1 Tax=Methanohalophilus levihalophilus TaxID=1431282 RepID=UPI001AEB041D|nr:ATP-grasp domain-containing protein [Methanohalophilus levihalophilus]MBP2031194.1 putative ATP-grasp superfamily ATP-dependent carboligase [Methanohalophilus levihalophilus]
MKKILVIGFSSRNIASSAHRAGYEVYAIDAFCDQDLQELAQECYELSEEDVRDIEPDRISKVIRNFNVDFDAVVLGSGFETLDRTIFDCPVRNNGLDSIMRVSNKKQFADELNEIGIPHPETWNIGSHPEIKKPMILKPKTGGGGVFNRVVNSENELENAIEELGSINPNLSKENLLLQQFVTGIPASVSVISTGTEARAIAVNEQLIGIPWLTRMPFAYCGNITPFDTPYKNEMMGISEKLCTHFELVGSNGVDFLITEKGPIVLEINARFQGSLDSIEMATGLNLFETHIRSFEGILPAEITENRFAARAIIYVDGQPLQVGERPGKWEIVTKLADIPKSNHIAEQDEPFLSILETGQNRQELMENLQSACQTVRNDSKLNN